MQVQGPSGPPGQLINWVPMLRSSGEVFGYCVAPCPPYTYFSDMVCPMSSVPQAEFRRVPVRVLFSDCTCRSGMTFASPVPQQDVQQVEKQPEGQAEEPFKNQFEEQVEEQVEEEDAEVVSCSPDSTADDEFLSDPLERQIRQLFRQIGHCLPGGKLPGSPSRGKAFSKAYQKKYREEINRSGNPDEARRLAKLAGSAASENEKNRLEQEAAAGSIEYLKDVLATACNRAVHRQYQIARRAELRRSGDPVKAKAAARLASKATRLRLERIGGIDNSFQPMHFTDADILNASYMGAYRRARNRELSCSGDLIKAKQAGRVAGNIARAQTEQELWVNPVATRRAFKITPSMAAGKAYRAAYGQAKDRAYKLEMACSGDPVSAEAVACEAARNAGREARKTFILSCRLRISVRPESDKSGASGTELRENITEYTGQGITDGCC